MSTNQPTHTARATIPANLTFFGPTVGRAGRWAVVHTDGTTLFESEVESEARARLELLEELLRKRIAAGLPLTGRDVLVVWPATSPAALLGVGADTETWLSIGPRVAGGSRPPPPPTKLSAAQRDELVVERGERYAREAGVDVGRASSAELVPHFERARRELRTS